MVKIETVRGTPEGDVIRTMKYTPEKEEGWRSLIKSFRKKTQKEDREKFIKEIKRGVPSRKLRKQRLLERKKIRAIKDVAKAKAQKQIYVREMIMQRKMMQQQRQFEAERLAQQQRSFYEVDDMSMQPQQQMMPTEQVQESVVEKVPQQEVDDYGRPKQKGGFGAAWKKWMDSRPARDMERPRMRMPTHQPIGNLLTPERTLLSPVDGPLVREPSNLLSPVNGSQIPWRLKIW